MILIVIKNSDELFLFILNKLMAEQDKNIKEIWWQKPLMIFSQLSAWIGFPIVLAVLLGNWLDQKYQTKPWLFLVTVALAFIISTVGIIKTALKSIKEIEIMETKTKDKKKEIPD